MKRRSLFLVIGASLSLVVTASVFLTAANRFSFLRATGGEATLWKHYAAVAESEDMHGSKEFWASCDDLGYHVFTEPTQGTIEEGGDFAETPFFDALTYKDDRYVPSLFEMRNAVYPVKTGTHTYSYGLYPQSVIYDDVDLLQALNALDESVIGPNGWYLYNGFYYAKMITPNSISGQRFDNGESIGRNKTYWFLCEPIQWTVLSSGEGEKYLLSTMVLDAKCYYDGTSNRTIEEKTISPNNYQYSDIRTWLNADFYASAFALGNGFVATTSVDNSAKTTETGTNPYGSETTEDKVFLPSYRDYMNVDYGFINSEAKTSTRTSRTSEWSRAWGAPYEKSDVTNKWNGNYWTRSPKATYMRDVHVVESDGYINGGYNNYDSGVRPAITLAL